MAWADLPEVERIGFLRYRSANLRERVEIAIAKCARNVYFESAATPNHANRLSWANEVLFKPGYLQQERERVAWLVVLLPEVIAAGEAYPQATLETLVANNIDSVFAK